MRAVVQRVTRGAVRIDGRTAGEIGKGLVVLAAFAPGDGEAELSWMAEKLAGLRIFPDRDGLMNRSTRDAGGALLVVSQFTLYGDVSRGRRPSFIGAADPDEAERLYDRFLELCESTGLPVESGEFGAMMEVDLVNDGPVTLVIDRDAS
ncbi:MAG TPA: D-aminoacyl-tRNA deacylase [Gemmatimonadota bacterium]|nr:D-aminoacyl-tRNA deacylase [Gemmatimonadota bacterium]